MWKRESSLTCTVLHVYHALGALAMKGFKLVQDLEPDHTKTLRSIDECMHIIGYLTTYELSITVSTWKGCLRLF